MNKILAQEIANALFGTYPSVNEFHITADGQAFEVKEMANCHAMASDKKEQLVITCSRDNNVETPVEETPSEETLTEGKKAPAKKAASK